MKLAVMDKEIPGWRLLQTRNEEATRESHKDLRPKECCVEARGHRLQSRRHHHKETLQCY